MKISKNTLIECLNGKNPKGINLIFLGMSGIGKTYWSKKLSLKYNMGHVEIDKLIGESVEFSRLINEFPGKEESEKMGNFFGKPWEKENRSKEKKYLEIEEKIMSKNLGTGVIIDLTGSAIYHPKQMEHLIKNGLVICLGTSEEMKVKMLKDYISNPKPVCWKGLFSKRQEETAEEALERCYFVLLKSRETLYRKYANVTLPHDTLTEIKEPEQLIEEITKRLD